MKKVLLGMSGGVDSSVAAALLIDMGYDVTGVTFKLWHPMDDIFDREDSCCSIDDVNDAKDIADILGIPHYTFNFKDVFKKNVVDYFVEEYKNGKTPNPCIVCNKSIKFDHFYNKAMSMGFNYISTGHYAKIIHKDGQMFLAKAEYDKKDQSYFLYNIPKSHLEKTLFPLGKYTKPQVRELAEKYNLGNISSKKDSQEICFIDKNGYNTFLEGYTFECSPKGNFIDISGNILGKHKGFWNYTIGQRKGLGITFNKPMFVSKLDPITKEITLCDEIHLFSNQCNISDTNWLVDKSTLFNISLNIKIRNQAKFASGKIYFMDNNITSIEFDKPQRAITKGQSAVIYINDIVAGGGIIQ